MSPKDFSISLHASQPRTLFLPEGFDPRDVLPAGVHRYANGIRVVIDRLLTGGIMIEHRRGNVPLPKVSMVKLFGNDRTWAKVKDAMMDRRVMSSDEKYWNGPDPKTKWYRLLSPWSDLPTEPWTLRDERYLRWVAAEEHDRPIREHWAPVHYRLHEWLKRTTVVVGEAEAIIAAMPPQDRRRATLAVQAVNANKMPTLDAYGHRWHSAVTCLPRILRSALLCDGRRFDEVDVSNSQPFLLGLLCLVFPVHPALLIPEYWTEEGERRANQPSPRLSLLRERSLCIWHQNAPTGYQCPDDLRDYLTACSEGRYYETLAERSGLPCGDRHERDKVKTFNCRLMYGKTRENLRAWQSYKAKWATVASYLECMKTPDYHGSSMELQRAESELMLRGVCHEFTRMRPDIPLLTIHDALLVPSEAKDEIRRLIQSYFGCFGFPVHLK